MFLYYYLIVVHTTIRHTKETELDIGSTENTFKNRCYSHKNSFKNYKHNGSELAKYVRNLKNNKFNYDIKWSILNLIGEFKNIHNICNTCILE